MHINLTESEHDTVLMLVSKMEREIKKAAQVPFGKDITALQKKLRMFATQTDLNNLHTVKKKLKGDL